MYVKIVGPDFSGVVTEHPWIFPHLFSDFKYQCFREQGGQRIWSVSCSITSAELNYYKQVLLTNILYQFHRSRIQQCTL